MTTKGVVVRADLSTEVLEFTEANFLEIAQGVVGGLIEAVNLETGLVMWVNEEGMWSESDYNPLASEILAQLGQPQGIRGDVFFTGDADEEGRMLGVEAQDIHDIQETCSSARGLAKL